MGPMDTKNLLRHFLVYFVAISVAAIGICGFLWRQGQLPILGRKSVPNIILMTPFNGQLPNIKEVKENRLPPVGVMIENELEARQYQKGLSEAEIVYEAPTEGKITRFLAIFAPGSTAPKMGPIRSARTYFLDWMSEYKGVYAHVGGNPDVLRRLMRESEVFNADQFVFNNFFRRENLGKTAFEHTMFTTAEKMQALIDDQKWVWQAPPHVLGHKTPSSLPNDLIPPATKINIDFGHRTYVIDYEYDPAKQLYRRSQAMRPHIDSGNSKQIEASVVVVQRIKAWPNGDAEGSISMQTIGDGDAIIFIEGKAVPAKWNKKSLAEPTRFFYLNGKEVVFSSGPVWFEIVPTYNTVKYE